MFRSLMGGGRSTDDVRSTISSSSKSASGRRRKSTKSSSSSTVSASTSGHRKPSSRGDDRDRGLGDLSAYSASGRDRDRDRVLAKRSASGYPESATGESIASSYATAIPYEEDDRYTERGMKRRETDYEERDDYGRDRGDRDRERYRDDRDRDRVREKERRRTKSERDDSRERERDRDSRRRDRDRDRAYSGDTYGPPLASGALGGAPYDPIQTTQGPAPYPLNPVSGPHDAPSPSIYDPHVAQQFPGQFGNNFAEPYRPPNPAGAAADYYGDQGQSVQDQPGVRPKPPLVIPNSQAHLVTASPSANPPPEPSSVGEVGAAASYFADPALDVQMSGQPTSDSGKPPKPSKPSKPSRPSSQTAAAVGAGAAAATYGVGNYNADQVLTESPAAFGPPNPSNNYKPPPPQSHGHGVGAAIGGAAAGAAAGYMLGHHHSSSSSSGHVSQYTMQNQDDISQVGAGYWRPPGNTASYAAGAAGAAGAGYAASPLHPHHAALYHGSGFQGGAMAYQQRQRGPLDKFIDFWRDPEGVGKFEDYTEAIGVCKYCFEPGTTSKSAPRTHHYGRRRKSWDRISAGSRVDKQSRYASSEDEGHRRKSPKKSSWLPAILGGYAVKSLFDNKDFDDSYSVKSGQPIGAYPDSETSDKRSRTSRGVYRRSHSSRSRERYSYGIGDWRDYPRDHKGPRITPGPKPRSRSRSSSRSKSHALRDAAIGAAIGGVAASAIKSRKDRSRSQSPGRSTRKGRGRKSSSSSSSSSSNSSFDNISRPAKKSAGGFGSFFTASSENRKKARSNRAKSIFSFNNSSTSSLDNDLAFGSGFARRITGKSKSKRGSPKDKEKKDKKEKGKDVDAKLLALGATATALAASSHSPRSKRRAGEVFLGQGSRSGRSDYTSSASNDEGWEDLASDGQGSSASSALAFGASGNSSDSSGSGWGWGWGTKSKKKKKKKSKKDSRFPTAAALAAGAGAGALGTAALASEYHRDGNPASEAPSSTGSLQQVAPIPTSDPGRYDAVPVSKFPTSEREPQLVRPGPIPLQQPQPFTPVSQAVYTSQGPPPQPYTAPIIPALENPFPSYENQLREVEDYQNKNMTSASEILPKTERERRQHRRSDSTPIFATDPLESASEPALKRRSTGRDPTASVSFDLTSEQEDKQRRTERLERLKHDLGRRDKIQLLDNEADTQSAANSAPAEYSSGRDREREYKPEREREREAEKRLIKDTRSEPGRWYRDRESERESDRERERERERERQLERERDADSRRAPEDLERRDRERETSDWAGPVVAGAMGAMAASTILSGRSSTSKDDASDTTDRRRERREQRRAERRRTDPSTMSSVISGHPERPKLPEIIEDRDNSVSPTEVDHVKTAAFRGVGKKKAVYDDYAAFFTPDEIRHSPEISRQSTPTQPMPTIIEIEPADAAERESEHQLDLKQESKNPFQDPLGDYTGPITDYRALDRLPWPVPVLQVIEPTPPHSVSGGSVRDAASPVITPRELPDTSKEKEPEKPTASRVSWGEHQMHEYEVPSTSSERSSIDLHDHEQTRDFTFAPETTTAAHDPGYTYVSPSAVQIEDVNEDLEFAATVAAAAQAAGFDPALVTEDPVFRTRTSPPGSDTRERSISPTNTTRVPLPHAPEPPMPGPFHGYVEGEVQSPEAVRPDAPRSQFFADQPIFPDSRSVHVSEPSAPEWSWKSEYQPASFETNPASDGPWGRDKPKSQPAESEVRPASEVGRGSTAKSDAFDMKPASEGSWGWDPKDKSTGSEIKPASEGLSGFDPKSKSKSRDVDVDIKPASEGPWSSQSEAEPAALDMKPASEGPWGRKKTKSVVSGARPSSEGPAWNDWDQTSKPKPAIFDTKPAFVESPVEQSWEFEPKPAPPEGRAERAWGFDVPIPDEPVVEHVDRVELGPTIKDVSRDIQEKSTSERRHDSESNAEEEFFMPGGFEAEEPKDKRRSFSPTRNDSPSTVISYPPRDREAEPEPEPEIQPLRRTETDKTETDNDDIPDSIADDSVWGGEESSDKKKKRRKRRSKRESGDFNDTASVASSGSARSGRTDIGEKRKSTDDKGKKAGGFLASIFGSRVSEPVESKRSSEREKEKGVPRDVQSEVGGSRSRTSDESPRRHRHHRSSSRADSLDGRREAKSEVGGSRRSEDSPRRQHHRRDSSRAESPDGRREVRSEVGTSSRSEDSPLRRLHRSSSRADSVDGRREVRSEAGADSPRRRRHHHRTSSGGDSLDGRSRFDDCDREDRGLDRADTFPPDKDVNVESYKSSRQRREDKRRQRYGDEYEKEPRASQESQDSDRDLSFLVERPEMPPMDTKGEYDGASGPSSKDAVAAGLGLGLGSLALGAMAQRPRSHSTSPPSSQKMQTDHIQRSVSPGPTLARGDEATPRSRRPSDLRFADSTTAVPLHFRPPPTSPRLQRSPSITTESPTAQAQAVSPASPSQGRRSRPASLEFKNSREIRPLFLVERHGSSKVESNEPLPSLPSSKSGSSEDLPSLGLREGNAWESSSPNVGRSQQDVLGSQQNTPTRTTFGLPRHLSRKEELGYEFHSPSELLQEAESTSFPDLPPLPSAEGSTVGAKEEEGVLERALETLPPLPTSRPATPDAESTDKEAIPVFDAQQTQPNTTERSNIPGLYDGPGFAGVVDAAVAASNRVDDDDAETVTGDDVAPLADLPPSDPSITGRDRTNSETSFESASAGAGPSWGFANVVDAAVAAKTSKDEKPHHAESVADTTEDEFFDAMSRDGAASRGETPTPREEMPWEQSFDTPVEISTPTREAFGAKKGELDLFLQGLNRQLEPENQTQPELETGKTGMEESSALAEDDTVIAPEPEPATEANATAKADSEPADVEAQVDSSKKNKKKEKKGKSVDMSDQGEKDKEKPLETASQIPPDEGAAQSEQAPAPGFDHLTQDTKAETLPIQENPLAEQLTALEDLPTTVEAKPEPTLETTETSKAVESEPAQPEEPEETPGDAGLSKKAKKKKKKAAKAAAAEESVEESAAAGDLSAQTEDPVALPESAPIDEPAADPTALDKAPEDIQEPAAETKLDDLRTDDAATPQDKPAEPPALPSDDAATEREIAESVTLAQAEAPESGEPEKGDEAAQQTEPDGPLSRKASKKNKKKNKRKGGAEIEPEPETEVSQKAGPETEAVAVGDDDLKSNEQEDVLADTKEASTDVPKVEEPLDTAEPAAEATVTTATAADDEVSKSQDGHSGTEKDVSAEAAPTSPVGAQDESQPLTLSEKTEEVVLEELAEEKSIKQNKKKNRKSLSLSEPQPESEQVPKPKDTAAPLETSGLVQPDDSQQHHDAGTKQEQQPADTQTVDTISKRASDEPTQLVESSETNDSQPHVAEQPTLEPEAEPEAGEPSSTDKKSKKKKKGKQSISSTTEESSPLDIVDAPETAGTLDPATETALDDPVRDEVTAAQENLLTAPLQEPVDEAPRELQPEPAAGLGDVAIPDEQATPATEDVPLTAAQKKKAKKDKKKKRQSAPLEEPEAESEAATEKDVADVPEQSQDATRETKAAEPEIQQAESIPPFQELAQGTTAETVAEDSATKEAQLALEPQEDKPAEFETPVVTGESAEPPPGVAISSESTEDAQGQTADEPQAIAESIPEATTEETQPLSKKDKKKKKKGKSVSIDEPEAETEVAAAKEDTASEIPSNVADLSTSTPGEVPENQTEPVGPKEERQEPEELEQPQSSTEVTSEVPVEQDSTSQDRGISELTAETALHVPATSQQQDTVPSADDEETTEPSLAQEPTSEPAEPQEQEQPEEDTQTSASKKKNKKKKKKKKSLSTSVDEDEPTSSATPATEEPVSEQPSESITETTVTAESEEVAAPHAGEPQPSVPESVAEPAEPEDLNESPAEGLTKAAKKKAKKDKKKRKSVSFEPGETEPSEHTGTAAEPVASESVEATEQQPEQRRTPLETETLSDPVTAPSEDLPKDETSKPEEPTPAAEPEKTEAVNTQTEQMEPEKQDEDEPKSAKAKKKAKKDKKRQSKLLALESEPSTPTEPAEKPEPSAEEAVPETRKEQTAPGLDAPAETTISPAEDEQQQTASTDPFPESKNTDVDSTPVEPTTAAGEVVEEMQREPTEPEQSTVDVGEQEVHTKGVSGQEAGEIPSKQQLMEEEKASEREVPAEPEATEGTAFQPTDSAPQPVEEQKAEGLQAITEAEPVTEAEASKEPEPSQPAAAVVPQEPEPAVPLIKLSKKQKKKQRQAEKADAESKTTAEKVASSTLPAAEPVEEQKEVTPLPTTEFEATPVPEASQQAADAEPQEPAKEQKEEVLPGPVIDAEAAKETEPSQPVADAQPKEPVDEQKDVVLLEPTNQAETVKEAELGQSAADSQPQESQVPQELEPAVPSRKLSKKQKKKQREQEKAAVQAEMKEPEPEPETESVKPEDSTTLQETKPEPAASEGVQETASLVPQEQAKKDVVEEPQEPTDPAISEEQPVEPPTSEGIRDEPTVPGKTPEQQPLEAITGESQQAADLPSPEGQRSVPASSEVVQDATESPVPEEIAQPPEVEEAQPVKTEPTTAEHDTEKDKSQELSSEMIKDEAVSTAAPLPVDETAVEPDAAPLEAQKDNDNVPAVEEKPGEPSTGKSKKKNKKNKKKASQIADDSKPEEPTVTAPEPEPVAQAEPVGGTPKDQGPEPELSDASESTQQPEVIHEAEEGSRIQVPEPAQPESTEEETQSPAIAETKEQPEIVHKFQEAPTQTDEPALPEATREREEVKAEPEAVAETIVGEKSLDAPSASAEEPVLGRKESKKKKKKAKKQAQEQEQLTEETAVPATVEATEKQDVKPADVVEEGSLVEPAVPAETVESHDEPAGETPAAPVDDKGAEVKEQVEGPLATPESGTPQEEPAQDKATGEAEKDTMLGGQELEPEKAKEKEIVEPAVEKDNSDAVAERGAMEPEATPAPVSRKLSKKEKRKLKKQAPEGIKMEQQEADTPVEPVEPVKDDTSIPAATFEATEEQQGKSSLAEAVAATEDETLITQSTITETEVSRAPVEEMPKEITSEPPKEENLSLSRKPSKKEKKKRKGEKVEEPQPESEQLAESIRQPEQTSEKPAKPVEAPDPELTAREDEDAWPAIDWGRGKIDAVEQSSQSSDEAHAGPFVPEIPEFKESAIPEALLERPGETPEEAARDSKAQAIVGSTLERDVTTTDFNTPAADSALEKLQHVESADEKKAGLPKPGKIASIFPNLERGFFRRQSPNPSPTQSVKDGAEEETAEHEASRDSAIQVSEAPIAEGVEQQPEIRDSGYIASPALAQDDVFGPTAREASDARAELNLERSVEQIEPESESTGHVNIPAPVEKDDIFGPTTTKDLPKITTNVVPVPQLELPRSTPQDTIPESAPSCDLRRSPSIHGRHERHPKLPWSLEEPAPSQPDRAATPPKPLPAIAEKEPERSMVREGTPRLEMKPEHVLPRPQTPVRKFTDTALGRRAWPTPDNSDDDWEKVQKVSPQSLSPDRGSRSGSRTGILKTPEHKKPVLRPSRPGSTTSSTHSLRRVVHSASGDLRAAALLALAASEAPAPAVAPATRGDSQSRPSTPQPSRAPTDLDVSEIPSSSSYDPVTDKGKKPLRTMTDVYGWGETPSSPRSPNRPPSIRHRRSMQHLQELEFRLDHLLQENRDLTAARDAAEEQLRKGNLARRKSDQALNTRDADLRDREAELEQLQQSVEWFQKEVARLNEENTGLTSANAGLIATHTKEIQTIRQSSAREVEHLRSQNERLSSNLHERIKSEVEAALKQKNAELRRLREELESARDKVKELQEQISAQMNDNVIAFRGEDYFEAACQKLCGHVQQWVLRFSKHSDHRRCRKLIEIKDEKIADRFDNAILDGSDTDMYLADRVRRRDIFMSVVMTMVWEFVFTRYLFGMDREQRQKLKTLEKQLIEVGPRNSIHRWRATTLTLLSKRQAFTKQRDSDTEAVALEIFDVLSRLLPPPSNVESQLLESLRKVLRVAVSLSLEMRTQLAEYIMLPPLQPEFDTNGDLARQVFFNASLMNERSGETTSNEDLQAQNAVVRVVLFPLVVKKGNDAGEGEDEVVVCPAQVLVARPGKDKRLAHMASGDRMSIEGSRSVHSIAPSTMDMSMNMSMSNVV
ncbi:involucrin repeat protein [Aspergillus undulatus]|uniref:involucrin repeat protein n=1 Tax=Aspergillus undulatus TaxID=1810928 RepID=UPI003CCD3431